MVRIINNFYNPTPSQAAFLRSLGGRREVICILKAEKERATKLNVKHDNISLIHKNQRRKI